MTEEFFEESREQSRIKAQIVAHYFGTWASIIKGTAKKYGGKIGYADFFAGPGRYDDGTISTPVRVMETVLKDPELPNMFVSLFNDGNPQHADSLRATLASVPGIERLRYKPQVKNMELDNSTTAEFRELANIPSLFFIDPWGYKGLSCELIQRVVQDWGCEAIFFFNYNRINPGINNDAVRPHMDAIFGANRVQSLREKLQFSNPEMREAEILNALCMALMDCNSNRLVLPFRFLDDRGTRTSHHLIFVTKNFKGYDKMKEVMAKASSGKEQGVANFSYVPASPQQDFLYGYGRPLEDLRETLLNTYSGRTISVAELYEQHSVGTPFLLKNYREVLRELYDKGTVTATRSSGKPINSGFPPDIQVTFPERN